MFDDCMIVGERKKFDGWCLFISLVSDHDGAIVASLCVSCTGIDGLSAFILGCVEPSVSDGQ